MNAVDGFLPSRKRLSLSQNRPRQMKIDGPIARPQANLMDDFKKPEGFRGRAVPQLSNRGDYDRPINVNNRFRRPLEDTPNRKPRKKNRSTIKLLMRTMLVLIILAMGVTGYIFGKAWYSAHKVFKGNGPVALAFQKDIDPHLLNGEGDGRVNILLLGKGGENHSGGDLTDSILIASLDPINDSVTLLSVPRDLWVKPEGLWAMKINEVYTRAKDKALVANPNNKEAAESAGLSKISLVVEQYLGVKMHYYGIIDFTAFEEVVNTLGGIEVNLPEAYYDGTMLVGDSYLDLPAGEQQMNGAIALAYARSRYGAARGDFDRGAHQQIVLVGIKDKVLSLGTYANPLKVNQLLNTFGDRVQTNLSIDDLMRIYSFAKNLSSEKISHADMAQPPNAVVKTGVVNDRSVVIPKAGEDNFDEVIHFVRNLLKDGYIISENPSIVVLNGTNQAGLAKTKADELKSYGYNVISFGDAPLKGQSITRLIDNTKGQKKYTLRYLEQRFGLTIVNSIEGMDLSAYQADFIIVIGSQ